MRDHAIVSPHFWTGETGRQLRRDPDAQRIALYLMTCPSSNMIGLYYLPIPLICHEVGISQEGAFKGLARLSEAGFCAYDAPSETVFVYNMARYQLGESLQPKDNRVLAVQRQLLQMKNSIFYNAFLERYNDAYHLQLSPTSRPFEGASEPLGSKDQDKEKEKEQDLDPKTNTERESTELNVVLENAPESVLSVSPNGVTPPIPHRAKRGKVVRPSRKAPQDFVLTEEMRQWGLKDVPGLDLDFETAKFRDCEFQTPHTDWLGTWRNWMRRAWERLPPGQRVTTVNTTAPTAPKLKLAY